MAPSPLDIRLEVILDTPTSNTKHYYYPGDTVEGKIFITSNQSYNLTNLRLAWTGRIQVQPIQSNKDFRIYFDECWKLGPTLTKSPTKTLKGSTNVPFYTTHLILVAEDSPDPKLELSKNKTIGIAFKVQVPNDRPLPSSTEGATLNKIIYLLEAFIANEDEQKPVFFGQRVVPVLEAIYTKIPEMMEPQRAEQVFMVSLFTQEKEFTSAMRVTLPCRGCTPGIAIPVSISIWNNMEFSRKQGISISLFRVNQVLANGRAYTSPGEKVHRVVTDLNIVSENNEINSQKVQTVRVGLPIPKGTMPSISLDQSELLSVSYFIRVQIFAQEGVYTTAEGTKSQFMMVDLPFTVGTLLEPPSTSSATRTPVSSPKSVKSELTNTSSGFKKQATPLSSPKLSYLPGGSLLASAFSSPTSYPTVIRTTTNNKKPQPFIDSFFITHMAEPIPHQHVKKPNRPAGHINFSEVASATVQPASVKSIHTSSSSSSLKTSSKKSSASASGQQISMKSSAVVSPRASISTSLSTTDRNSQQQDNVTPIASPELNKNSPPSETSSIASSPVLDTNNNNNKKTNSLMGGMFRKASIGSTSTSSSEGKKKKKNVFSTLRLYGRKKDTKEVEEDDNDDDSNSIKKSEEVSPAVVMTPKQEQETAVDKETTESNNKHQGGVFDLFANDKDLDHDDEVITTSTTTTAATTTVVTEDLQSPPPAAPAERVFKMFADDDSDDEPDEPPVAPMTQPSGGGVFKMFPDSDDDDELSDTEQQPNNHVTNGFPIPGGGGDQSNDSTTANMEQSDQQGLSSNQQQQQQRLLSSHVFKMFNDDDEDDEEEDVEELSVSQQDDTMVDERVRSDYTTQRFDKPNEKEILYYKPDTKYDSIITDDSSSSEDEEGDILGALARREKQQQLHNSNRNKVA